MLKEVLKNIVAERRRAGAPDYVIKNLLKEYLQYPVLEFIYNSSAYRDLIFTGGSCLRVCFGAPRLSEDLDFDLPPASFSRFNFNRLAQDIKKVFIGRFMLPVAPKRQGKGRLYLKFPILKDLELARAGESDLLYVKLEIQPSLFSRVATEKTPIFNYGFNFVARNYSLPLLFVGKINAFLNRAWFKGKKNEVNIKGRDLYDLYWFLEKGVEPDKKALKSLVGVKSVEELKRILRARVERNVTAQKLSYDLKNFFPDQNFVSEFCRNYKKIVGKYL